MTNTTEEEKVVNQKMISGRIIFIGCGSSSISESSTSNIQVYTLCGGGSSKSFTMAGQDPTLRLPEFRGDGSDDLEKHLLICENIWEAK
jgi:hypothetical protein